MVCVQRKARHPWEGMAGGVRLNTVWGNQCPGIVTETPAARKRLCDGGITGVRPTARHRAELSRA